MAVEVIARLEELVDRLLSERGELQQRNAALAGERDRLLQERVRVSDDLDKLLSKLDRLQGREQ